VKEIAMKRTAISPNPWYPLGFAVLGVVVLTLTAFKVGPGAAQDDQFRDVREPLKRAAQVYAQPLRGVQWTKISKLGASDHPLYQVQGTNERGNKVEVEVTSAGRIVEVEEHGIPIGEVPPAVVTALKAKMPQFEPEKVEAIYQTEKPQPVCYGFEGVDADGRRAEVYISADGKTFLN
jgi:hypothetical protein